MIASVLSQKYNIVKSRGNFNNHIGLPLTIFNMQNDTEVFAVEMGMNHAGEISYLSKIAKPDTAVITNIGLSHIGNLGSVENILKAKLEILDGMPNDGVVVLNGDDKLLYGLHDNLTFETVYYGIDNFDCDILAYNVALHAEYTKFSLKFDGNTYDIKIDFPGIHYVYDALAAISVGIRYNVPIEKIIAGISGFVPSGMRQEITKTKDCVIIEDCYNASPQSMVAALDVLVKLHEESALEVENRRKVAVLGDMLELGEYSEVEHKKIGAKVAELGIDFLILVGNFAKCVAVGAIEAGFDEKNIVIFGDSDEASKNIMNLLRVGDFVLFKASRAMQLELVADEVKSKMVH
jgi:UDP-N-acetylmuramoyl-tripeptide--D-alanyl-D-alanine ligase